MVSDSPIMLSDKERAEVDAYIASPEHQAWEQKTLARWFPERFGPEAHQRRERELLTARRNAADAGRRAAKLNRTPPWADRKAMAAIYRQARALTQATGIPHHVDHEIPLRGKLVSGLHVHGNLQILIGTDNCRKNNHFEIEP